MEFVRVEPTGVAAKAIECYWTVKDDDPTPLRQKIVPDGFTEIIFHFGDHYRINLNGQWKKQSSKLLAGQLTKYFYLENSGVSNMLGIKFKPSAITHLFGISMKDHIDRVVTLDRRINIDIANVDGYFNDLCRDYPADHPVDRAVDIMFEKHGMVSITEICKAIGVGERYLQQLFQRYVGLTPKFFARIVRFSYVFKVVKEARPDWADVVYKAGFYDQSHFIRNFKSFTGEDPSEYIFSEKTLANFFMKGSHLYNR